MSSQLELSGVVKRFGQMVAVDHLDLEVESGEFLTLLGPSGCGKSTTLRIIAGLERPDEGSVSLGGTVMTSAQKRVFTPPEKRGMGMVFQSYAVWPHMTVEQNVGFPLMLRHVPADERRDRVREALRMVGLDGLEKRGATKLSGGQQQRVALARALVHNPSVLLLDEPLSNLDAKLREQMRLELRMLQKRLGITTIFVTHDQAEAMVLSDRIVVMNRGRVEQIGCPDDIYERPSSRFVMDFVGRVNYVQCVAENEGLSPRLRAIEAQGLVIPGLAQNQVVAGERITVCIRPEDIEVIPPENGSRESDWPVTIQAVTYLGHRVEYVLSIGGVSLIAEGPAETRISEGAPAFIRVPAHSIRMWSHDSEDQLGGISRVLSPAEVSA